MPTFDFTSPDGKKYSITGPEGATQEQAWGILQKQLSAAPAPAPAPTVPEGSTVSPSEGLAVQPSTSRSRLSPEQKEAFGRLRQAVAPEGGVLTPPGGWLAAAKRLPAVVGRRMREEAGKRKADIEQQGDIPSYEGGPVARTLDITSVPRAAAAEAYMGKPAPGLAAATMLPGAVGAAGALLGITSKAGRAAMGAVRAARTESTVAREGREAAVAAVEARKAAATPPTPPGEPPKPPPPPMPEPPKPPPGAPPNVVKPPKEFVKDLTWQTDMLKGGKTADAIETRKFIRQFDREYPELKTPAARRTFYNKIERGTQLDPNEQAALARLQPARDEASKLYAENRRRLGDKEEIVSDPNYIQAMAIGHWPALEEAPGNPALGNYGKTISKTAHSMQAPKYVAVVDLKTGERRIAEDMGDGELRFWDTGAAGKEEKFSGELRAGNKIEINGKQYDAVRAFTDEKETHTPTKYHRDPVVAITNTLSEQRELKRNLDFFDFLKNGGSQFMTRRLKSAPKDWRETKLQGPSFKGVKFHPLIANVLDDYYRPGMGSEAWLEALRRVNHVSLNAMFFGMPLPHIANVAAHWTVATGWDWLPHALPGMVRTMGEAFKEVLTTGPKYLQALKEGNGLIYGSMINQDLYRALGKRMASEVEQRPENWGQIAKTLGMKPVELIKTINRASQKTLWAANDIFMMQRVLMLQRGTALRKGKGLREAIETAEKHIPSYKLPSTVLGSRGLAQLLGDNAVLMFNRYHYGALNSFANMAKDIAKGSRQERLEAIGHLMVLGMLGFVAKPYLDKAAQALTDDPTASVLPRGPLAYTEAAVSGVKALARRDPADDFWKAIGNLLIISPPIQVGIDLARRNDWRGKHITQADDPLDTQVVQMGAHALETLLPPAGMVTQGLREGGPGILQTARNRALGIHQPSEAEKKFKANRAKRDAAAAKSARKSESPLVSGYRRARGYLTGQY